MSEQGRETRKIATAAGEIWCRRLGRALPVTEHVRCNYCFGEVADVRSGDHARFCDFDPAKDPIQFGFPDGGGWAGER